jgi:hypothetical protein
MQNENFEELVSSITSIGQKWHATDIVLNSKKNSNKIKKTISQVERDHVSERKAIVISAGPSLHTGDILPKIAALGEERPLLVAIDGSYVKCLRAGIVPDYVVTLDPHPTRMVRWFGDPNFEKNSFRDDYFSRQDLDIDFREESTKRNNENILLVDEYASRSRLIISVTSPSNLVKRAFEAGFEMFWWTPLVDDPELGDSLTSKMYGYTKCPALNTGGNVGTAAWIFAKFWLEVEKVAVVGMDLGYRLDLPHTQTQTYYELQKKLGVEKVPDEYFPVIDNPHTKSSSYIDPTYQWYLNNFLEILSNTGESVYNCSGDGNFFGQGVHWSALEDFLLL